MTTLTTRSVPVHLEEDASLQPLPWRRMAWVTWRQHRVALVGLAVLLGALGGVPVAPRPPDAPRLRNRHRVPPSQLRCLRECDQ